MNTIARFVLDDKRNVLDVLNPTRKKGYCREETPETQIDLRERILMVRLGELIENLIEPQPEVVDKFGIRYQASRPEKHSIWIALYSLVRATHLYALDPAVALKNRFAGTLVRDKVGLRSFTSLSLFNDAVECLLRDLYGDVDGLERIVRAMFVVVEELAQYAHHDLWKEHQDADAWDYARGIGVSEGYGISGSEWRRGMLGAEALRLRAIQIRETPSNFGKYTREFGLKHIGDFLELDVSPSDADDLPF